MKYAFDRIGTMKAQTDQAGSTTTLIYHPRGSSTTGWTPFTGRAFTAITTTGGFIAGKIEMGAF